jgi:hypothetical protein
VYFASHICSMVRSSSWRVWSLSWQSRWLMNSLYLIHVLNNFDFSIEAFTHVQLTGKLSVS